MFEKEYIMAVTKYSAMVYRIAFHYCASREDAEDIMQNVFVKLYRYEKDFPQEEDCKRWLIRVTVNECHSLFRSFWRSRKQELKDYQWEQFVDESVSFEEGLLSQCNELFRAVMGLPARYRISTYLYYYEDYSIRQIADILQCKETTVQTRLMRARNMLRQRLQGGFGDDE